jgi:Rrf2 family protein
MRLTRRGEYALRAALDLASLEDGHLARSQDIADRQDIPPKFLPQIINALARAEIIETVRGAAGGVRLARPAAEVTVGEIVEVIDGPVALNECVVAGRPCKRRKDCSLAPVWDRAQTAMMDVLMSTTLADLEGDPR